MKSKIIKYILVFLSACFLMAGCGSGNDENVQFVKGGAPNRYPDKTYGEAFEDFFGNPKWKSFSTDTGVEVVEFTGNCLFDNTEVEALIQFTLDKEAGTFSVTYLSLNDISQNNLMITSMLEAIFGE